MMRFRSALAALLALAAIVAGCRKETPGELPEHVFLVTIDTLRADHLGFMGYPRQVSPFLDRLASRADGEKKEFAPEARAALLQATFPGNIRQLQNVVERCVVLSTGPVIPKSQVLEAMQDETAGLPTLDEAKNAFERRYIASLLRATNGNVTGAAKIAGRNRTEFYNLLARHSLEPETFRSRDD